MCVGSDFINEEGERETSIQLVDKHHGSIAHAFFVDEKLYKDTCLADVDRTRFLDDCETLLDNSIPVRFNKTVLPKELEIGPL